MYVIIIIIYAYIYASRMDPHVMLQSINIMNVLKTCYIVRVCVLCVLYGICWISGIFLSILSLSFLSISQYIYIYMV